MTGVFWFTTSLDLETLDLLTPFDHHQIEIRGDIAVLMAYVDETNPTPALFAVHHPAADRYPVVPPWVQCLLDDAGWQPWSGPGCR